MSTEMKPAGPVYLAQQLAESEAENNRLRQEVQRLNTANVALAQELQDFRMDATRIMTASREKHESETDSLADMCIQKDRVINVLLDACERGGAK